MKMKDKTNIITSNLEKLKEKAKERNMSVSELLDHYRVLGEIIEELLGDDGVLYVEKGDKRTYIPAKEFLLRKA